MHPELMRQVAMARMAGFQRDAIRYRRAREGYSRPPQPVRTAVCSLMTPPSAYSSGISQPPKAANLAPSAA